MRILFSLTYYSPYISGLTAYVQRLAQGLVKRGFNVRVITMQYSNDLPKSEIRNEIHIIRCPAGMTISKGFLSPAFLFTSLKEAKNCDVVIIALPQFEGFIPAFLGRLFGKKVITVYLSEVVLPETFFNRIVQRMLYFSNWLSLSLSNTIVTYGYDFMQNSCLLPSFSQKIKYIHPPIIKPKIDKRVKEILIKKMGKRSDYTIGVISRISREKGIEFLLDAIVDIRKNLPNKSFKIFLVGPTDAVGEKVYQEKISSLLGKYKNTVVLLGRLKEIEMGAFYSLLDVLVLPSVNSTEAFGMVQVEAMMMGVPVVASQLPGVSVPIQTTGMGKLVHPRDSSSLARAVVAVLKNPKKYSRSRVDVGSVFSYDKTVDFFKTLICDAV